MTTTAAVATEHAAVPIEARSGLDPWTRADLPAAPTPRGLGWLAVVGPGVIVLGLAIGSGEFLLGPAAFVKYGLSLLWVTYAGLYFAQAGWPAWTANAAGAVYFLIARRLPGPADARVAFYIAVGTFLVCVVVLLIGRRIERTLELLNWVMKGCGTCSLATIMLRRQVPPPLTHRPYGNGNGRAAHAQAGSHTLADCWIVDERRDRQRCLSAAGRRCGITRSRERVGRRARGFCRAAARAVLRGSGQSFR